MNDDDLFAPLPDIIRLGGAGPFVINLSTSPMPIALPSKSVLGEMPAHLYQVQRVEDGRPRYRLRLGLLTTEELAELVLPAVRAHYPGALIARADAEDLRAAAKFPAIRSAMAARPTVIEATPAAPIKAAVAVAAVEPPFILSLVPDEVASAPAASAAPPQAQTAATQTTPAPPKATVAHTVPPATRSTPAMAKFAPPPQAAPPTKQVAPASTPIARPASRNSLAQAPGSSGGAPAKPAVRRQDTTPARPAAASHPVPSVPTTRTVRALTTLELEDDKASRWFVIQLALAGEAFEPEAVPNLDIFSAYRLYSVAGIDQGRIVHALRLGFFTDEGAARAVASYLESFYEKPTIRRVSYAEHQRFADESMAPRKDVGATGKQAVIEITNERFVRASRGLQAPK